MAADLLGQLYSLLAALTFAIALVFYRWSGAHVGPLALNLFKNVVALVLFAGLLALAPAEWATFADLTPAEWTRLAISAVIGIALADTLFLAAINRLGVGLMVIIDCLYSPSAVLFAWLLFGETITLIHLAGGVLVLSGIVISSYPRDTTPGGRRQLLGGFAAGVTATVGMGFGIIFFDPLIEAHALVPITAARLLIATIPLLLYALLAKPEMLHAFKPSVHWRTSIPAAVLATFLSLLFWHAGFKYTSAAAAAILNQMSTIFALLLAAVLLHERLTPRKVVAVVVAFVGVMLIIRGDGAPDRRTPPPIVLRAAAPPPPAAHDGPPAAGPSRPAAWDPRPRRPAAAPAPAPRTSAPSRTSRPG
jgi:drug/metabolite transporter (DMT)-like permease